MTNFGYFCKNNLPETWEKSVFQGTISVSFCSNLCHLAAKDLWLLEMNFFGEKAKTQSHHIFVKIYTLCTHGPYHLSMKEGSLFCFVVMRSIELGCFRSCSWCLWKALTRRGAWAWFHVVWTRGAKVFEYWMISSQKTKLNCSWKFWRNWNVPLVLLERSWWAEFNGLYLVRFGLRMWEILIFKWFFSAAENSQKKSKKPRSWKEKSVEAVVTLALDPSLVLAPYFPHFESVLSDLKTWWVCQPRLYKTSLYRFNHQRF
jgi:hypothetical protein